MGCDVLVVLGVEVYWWIVWGVFSEWEECRIEGGGDRMVGVFIILGGEYIDWFSFMDDEIVISDVKNLLFIDSCYNY